jgi:alpha-beta hydrolase superfamily lysophospholipase
MRLAREPNPQRVADMSLRKALQALAEPRKPQPDQEVDDLGAPGNEARAQSQAAEDRDRRERFPRPGVERKTWRDIESDLAEADHKRRLPTKMPTLVPDAKADLLLDAKAAYEHAADSLGELAQFVRSARVT